MTRAHDQGGCSDLEYERLLTSLQQDGPRPLDGLIAVVRGALRRLEAESTPPIQPSAAAPVHTVRPLSPRVWWRLTRPE